MVNVVSHHNVVNNSHVPELWLIFKLSLNTWHNQDTNMTSLWEPCNLEILVVSFLGAYSASNKCLSL